MTRGHLTEYSWNAHAGNRDTRDILFRQRHDSYRVSFNVYPGETAKLKIKSPEPRPPPYQRHAVTPHQDPHATFSEEIPEIMIKKRLWFDEVISYAIVSLSSLAYLASKRMLTEEDHNCNAPVWAFGGPLTIRIIWELIPVALLYFCGVPPQNLQPSAYIEFLSSGSITFSWMLPLKYCKVCWLMFGVPLGLLLNAHRCSMNAVHAFQISSSLSYGAKCRILGRLYQGDKHCVLFLVYSCLSLVCAMYAYWGFSRYFSLVTVFISQ